MRGSSHNNVSFSYTETMRLEHKQNWHKTMQDKFSSPYESNIRILVDLSINRKAIPVCWTFDIRMDSKNLINRFKACLIRKGLMQA